LSEERSRKEIRLSTSHPRSRDSSLREESEERSSTRSLSKLPSNLPRKRRPSTKKCFLNSSRRKRLFITRKKMELLNSRRMRKK